MPKNYGTVEDDYDVPTKKYVDDEIKSHIDEALQLIEEALQEV